MKPIDMQKVHGSILKVIQGLIKGAPDQGGESGVVGLVMPTYLLKDLLPIVSCMIIPPPSIDGVAAGI
jgi:hypothetical protein